MSPAQAFVGGPAPTMPNANVGMVPPGPAPMPSAPAPAAPPQTISQMNSAALMSMGGGPPPLPQYHNVTQADGSVLLIRPEDGTVVKIVSPPKQAKAQS